MKKFLLALFTGFYATSVVFSQNEVDSLENVLETEIADTTRVQVLTDLSRLLTRSNFEKAMTYGEEAVEVAKVAGDQRHLMIAYRVLGATLFRRGEYEESIPWFEKGLPIAKEIKSDLDIAAFLNNIGTAYTLDYKYEKGLQYLLEALELREAINDPKIAGTWNNIGLAYRYLNEFEKALEYYHLARIAKEEQKDVNGLANTYTNIAMAYLNLGNYEEALVYGEKSLAAAREVGNLVREANALNNIGNIYRRSGNNKTALEYYGLAIPLKKQVGNKRSLGRTYNAMKELYFQEGDNEKAQIYLDLTAENYGKKKSYYSDLARLDSARGNYKTAFENLKIWIDHYKDELDQEAIKNISQLEAELDLVRKNSEIENLSRQNEIKDLSLQASNRQKIFLGSLLLLLFLIAGIVFRLYRERTKRNKTLKELNSTKDRLFSLVAHDIKNPLSAFTSITNSLVENQNTVSKEDMGYFLEQLSKASIQLNQLLKNLLDWSLSQSGKLNCNPEQIVMYDAVNEAIAHLQVSAQLKNITVKNNVSPELASFGDYKMIVTVIRNLVSNAIKFTAQGGEIRIETRTEGNETKVMVRDNGIGISSGDQGKLFQIGTDYKSIGSSTEKGTGLGLQLCHELIQLHHGEIGVRSELGTGSEFYFTLPPMGAAKLREAA